MSHVVVTVTCLLCIGSYGATGRKVESGQYNATVGTAQVNAAELVRAVRESENWVHQVDSLYIRIEGKWTRTPERIAATRAELEEQFPDSDLDPNRFTDLKPTSTETLELYFDQQKLRYLYDQHGEAYMLRIWDGNQAISHENYMRSQQEHYYLGAAPDRIFDSMLADISWLRSQPHSFWWQPIEVETRMQYFGHPEDFVITGRSNYRGVDCYVLECEPQGLPGRRRRWHVGTKDRRLYGLPTFLKGKINVEHFTLDYREVARGCWFPMTQGYEFYGRDPKDEPYLRFRRDLKVVEVRVNEKLPDELFMIELKDRVTVVDERSGKSRTYIYESEPTRLIGKVLPRFEGVKIDFSPAEEQGRAILVCFWDISQRPSRYMVRHLAMRAKTLREKGITIVAVQAGDTDEKALSKWLQKHKISFPVGIIRRDDEYIRHNWDVRGLPWLILTDRQHMVQAEGFRLEELGEKTKEFPGMTPSDAQGVKSSSPQVKCSGKVVDADGNILAGAEVAAFKMVSDGVAGNIRLLKIGEVTTKEDGGFLFETEAGPRRGGLIIQGQIVALKKGLAVGWGVWDMYGDSDLTIRLGKPKRVEGVVVDEAGTRVVGADLRANLQRKEEWLAGISPLEWLAAKSDNEGRFRFKNIPADCDVDLLITAPGRATIYTYQAGPPPDFRGGAGPRFKAGQTDIKIVVRAEARIEGKVVDRNSGEGIVGVKLAVVPTFSPAFFYRFVCESGKDGSFSVGGLHSAEYLIRGDFPSLYIDAQSGTSPADVIIGVDCARKRTKSHRIECDAEANRETQIQFSFRLFEVPSGVDAEQLGLGKSVSDRVVVLRGQEYAGRFLALSEENKDVKLLSSAGMLTNNGEEGHIFYGKEITYTAGYECEAGDSGEPEPILENTFEGVKLRVKGEVQEQGDTVHVELNIQRRKPIFEARKHRKGYEYQVPVGGAYFSTELTVTKNEPVIVGCRKHNEPSLYLVMSTYWASPPREPDSLTGKSLPQFRDIKLEISPELTKGNAILVCFVDMNQRPSRHMVRELAKRSEYFKENDVEVVCVQASKVERGELDEWVKENKIPFAVGMIEGDEEKTRFNWGVKSLPWLILTDRDHVVRSEGFGLEEMGEKLPKMPPRPLDQTHKSSGSADQSEFISDHMESLLSNPKAEKSKMTWHPGGPDKLEGMPVDRPCLRVHHVPMQASQPRGVQGLAGQDAVYGRAAFADYGRTEFACGLRKSSPEVKTYDIFFIDLNRNGRFEEKELFKGEFRSSTMGPDVIQCHYGAIDLPLRGKNGPRIHRVFVWLHKLNERDRGDLYLTSHCYFSATIQLGGRQVKAVLVDYNCDGRYDSGKMREGPYIVSLGPRESDFDRIGWDQDGDGKIQFIEQQFVGSYVLEGQEVYRIGVTPDGETVAVVPVEVPIGRLQMPVQNAFVRLVGEVGPINLRVTEGVIDVPAGTYWVAYLHIDEPGEDGQITRLKKFGKYFDKPWEIHAGSTTTIQRVLCEVTDNDKKKYEARVRKQRATTSESKTRSILGKPLGDLHELSIQLGAQETRGRRILVCFWGIYQRPSRHLVRELAKRADKLKEKNVVVVCVQVSKVQKPKLDEWVNGNKIPFEVGMIEADEEKVRFNWGVKALPWLILTDREHIVRAEGFGIEELDEKLGQLAPAPAGPQSGSIAIEPGQMAPDFELPRLTIGTDKQGKHIGKISKETVRLSSFRAKKPVFLIFSSYT